MDERAKRIFRAEFVFVRCLSGWHRLLRTAVSRPRIAHSQNTGADSGLPLRSRLSLVRRAGRRLSATSQGGGRGDPGTFVRVTFGVRRLAAAFDRPLRSMNDAYGPSR